MQLVDLARSLTLSVLQSLCQDQDQQPGDNTSVLVSVSYFPTRENAEINLEVGRFQHKLRRLPDVPAVALHVRTTSPRRGAEHDLQPRSVSLCSNPERAHAGRRFVMLAAVLSTLHRAVSAGKVVWKRDVYYAWPRVFASQTESNTVLSDLSAMTQCSPDEMGVRAQSGGMVFGPVRIGNRVLESGYASTIPGASTHVQLLSTAHLVLVLEKDTLFSRLLEFVRAQPDPEHAEFHGFLASRVVVVTGCGYPSLTVRAFLRQLAEQHPSVPFACITDSDPDGLYIASTYAHGSSGSCVGSAEAAVLPELRWLGLGADAVSRASVPLTSPDKRKLESLIERLEALSDATTSAYTLLRAAKILQRRGRKTECEALHARGPLHFAATYLKERLQAANLWL